MSDGSTKGFFLSATLHGAVAVLLFLNFVLKRDDSDRVKVFELVAGEGDNYMATEAPALGSPTGVKMSLPKAQESKPMPPEPIPPEVVTPAPTPPTPKPKVATPIPPPTTPPDPNVPNFKKKLQRDVIVAESKAKREIKKEREAEAKRAAEEAKRAAEDAKKLTKEEFDRQNKTKTVASANKSNPAKSPKLVDAEGIAKGVVGGSTANKVGGAGGKALKTDNTDILAGYDALFKQRLRVEFEPPPGLSDTLKVEIEVRSNADGTLTGGRVMKSSGSSEFDRAVLDALRRVRMPARPDKKSETIEFIFNMREREG
jgi:colicin import membrane protein